MAILRRISLWVLTNLAIIAIITIIAQLLSTTGIVNLNGSGQLTGLLIMSALYGFVGSFISLLISKWMAKRTMRVQVITTPRSAHEQLLVSVCNRIAQQLSITPPEVGIYPSNEVNAFATGRSRNNSLVAVSQGMLDQMSPDEIEGVVGHEMAHIANGDMVTMTLLQGVLNTFVIFFARLLASALTRSDDGIGSGVYFIVSLVLQFVLGFLASFVLMAFSRWREFHADAGSARFVGKNKMIAALQGLQRMQGRVDPNAKPSIATMKISGGSSISMLRRSHPPLADRIAALQQLQVS